MGQNNIFVFTVVGNTYLLIDHVTDLTCRRDMTSWRVEWIFADADDASFADPRCVLEEGRSI